MKGSGGGTDVRLLDEVAADLLLDLDRELEVVVIIRLVLAVTAVEEGTWMYSSKNFAFSSSVSSSISLRFTLGFE